MLHTFRGLSRKRVLVGLASATVMIVAPFALAEIISGSSSVASSSQVIITRLTVGTPTSTVVGNVLIANIAMNKASGADVTSVPSGWKQIAETDNDSHISIISYWKKADASDQSGTTYEWDINNQTQAEGGITAYSGIDSTNPIDSVASSTGFSTTATAPSVTTSVANEEVISLFATDYGKKANTPYFGSTAWSQKYNSPNSPYGPSIAAFDTLQTAAGSSGDLSSAIINNKPQNWVAQQIALRPLSANYVINLGDGTKDLIGVGLVYQPYSAQPFTTSAAGKLTDVTSCFWWAGSGSPSDNAVINIETDSGGQPSGTSLGSISLAGNTLPTHTAITDFGNPNISLAANTKYWLVYSRSGTLDNSNYYATCGQDTTGGGAYYQSSWVTNRT